MFCLKRRIFGHESKQFNQIDGNPSIWQVAQFLKSVSDMHMNLARLLTSPVPAHNYGTDPIQALQILPTDFYYTGQYCNTHFA